MKQLNLYWVHKIFAFKGITWGRVGEQIVICVRKIRTVLAKLNLSGSYQKVYFNLNLKSGIDMGGVIIDFWTVSPPHPIVKF